MYICREVIAGYDHFPGYFVCETSGSFVAASYSLNELEHLSGGAEYVLDYSRHRVSTKMLYVIIPGPLNCTVAFYSIYIRPKLIMIDDSLSLVLLYICIRIFFLASLIRAHGYHTRYECILTCLPSQ